MRIAPSPTGLFHVGTARTALFNWLFARKNNGVFIVRIEDTDKERSKKEYEKVIFDSLEWLGLDYDEGPIKGALIYKGNAGPYRQSERTERYHIYLKKLLNEGSAFWCYHTKEELQREKTEQEAKKEASRHLCAQRSTVNNQQIDGIIRFKNPGGRVEFDDLVKGKIGFDAGLLGDFSIAKDFDEALYNFAVVIDDCEMKISHVIRGDDHISNTPKQILMQKALGFTVPTYAHIPMILGPDKSKLSKRHGAISLLEYKEQGYLPDAMFNFLALLGWNSGDKKEILSRDQILERFGLERVQQSGAVFNIEKLDWMNGGYIRNMPIDELAKLCAQYLPERNTEYIKRIVALEQPRMKKLSQIGESTEFFFQEKLGYSKELLRWRDVPRDEIKKILDKLEKLLNDISEEHYTKEKLEAVIMPRAEEWGREAGKIDRGRTLWPLRVALTGRKASPGPFEVAEILGKQKCLQRVAEAISQL